MGKDRDKGFRGSKYNPSSSGEAGSLMGSNQSSGFIGFSAFATNITNATDPDYYQVEPEYRVLLKKLQKKDSVSRIKGLEELLSLFSKINIESPEFNVSSISPLMNAWEFMYKRLVNDDDRRVRDLANQCLGAIGSRIGKHLGPHVKSLLGPWILAICDQKDQSNSSALNSFQNIFPEKKRKDVFKFGHDEALTYLCENLQETPQTIGDNKSNNQDILQERYERCISNSLLAIEYLINQTSNIADESPSSSTTTTTTTTTATNNNTEIYEKIFEAQFFSFFQSKSSIIRKTAYRVLTTIIKKVPGYVDKNFKDFSSKILGLFSEKDSSTHLYMWDAIISFLKSYNDKAWGNVDVRKHVLPRLWAFFRAGCYGSYELSYPSILPLLTFIPNLVVIGTNESSPSTEVSIGFFKEFFSNLEKGLEIVDTQRQYGNPNNPERPSNLLLSCYLECLVYSSKKWGQLHPTSINTYLIDTLLSSFYKDYFTCQNLSYSEKLFIDKLIESTNKISNISELNNLKIQELFKNSNFLNNLFIKKVKTTTQDSESPTTTTTTTTSPALTKKEEKLIEPISNETFYSRLNSFLKSKKNIGGTTNGVQESFVKRLFSLSCDHLNDNDSDIQELSIKVIDIILNNFKIDQLFSNSNEIQSFLNDTIIPNLKKFNSNSNNVSLINNLISISITLLSSVSDNEIIKSIWSNILQLFSNTENRKYLIHLINFSNGKLNRTSQLLSNSILDSIIIEICNSSSSSTNSNKENEKLIQALLFNNNNNNNNNSDYSPIISNESIEKLINWLFNQLVELMETIQMNLLLEFNIDYLVELSRLIFSIPLNTSSSYSNIEQLVKKLLNQWTKFNIEINHRPSLSNYCSTCKPIESFLFSNSASFISILSILIDYVENSELVNGDPNLDYLSNCTISLINNNDFNESYSYLIKRFTSNPLVVNSIDQIKISWFRFNMITPFYLLNNIDQCTTATTNNNQEILSTATLFKVLIFNFKIIESFGFDKFIEISNITKSMDNNIKLLLLNLIFINGDNNLPTATGPIVSLKSVSSEELSTSSSFIQIRNYIESKSLSLVNQFIKSLFKYYSEQLFKTQWFTEEIIKNIGTNGVYSILLKLFIDYIVVEMDITNSKNYKSILLDTISTPSTIESIKELNLIQVLLPILSNELIEQHKDLAISKITNLSSSIPNNIINVSIQLSLISSIIISKQQQQHQQPELIILNDKEWLVLLNSIQMIQQWNSRIKLMKQQDPQLEITFYKEMEISLLNYLLLIVQYTCSKEIYLSNNQSLLIQSLLSIWLSPSKSIILNDNNTTTTTLQQQQYQNLIEYQSLKLYNHLISNNNNNMKFIIPGIGDQFQIDHSILVLNNWLNKVNGIQGKSCDASYSLELYSNTFEKMTNEIKYKIALTKLDALIELIPSDGTVKGIQKTSYTILEPYFTNENTQLVKAYLLEEASDDHQDDEKVEYIVVSSVYEKLLMDFESTWIPMKKNKNSTTINSKSVGQLILWNLLLRNYSVLDLNKRSVVNGWLNSDQKVIRLLNHIFQFANKDELPNLDYNQFPFTMIEQQQQSSNSGNTPTYSIIQQLCSHCIFSLVNYLPSMVRRWADENSTNSKMNQSIQNYITRFISPIIIQNEISRVNAYREPQIPGVESNNFQVKGLVSSREVTASYEKDEMTIALVLSIPETYPLRVLTVEFSKRLGVSESQWRQWLLSMTSLLLTQDGTVLDACLLWKSSLDKHFQGVEVCPICYSMFHNGTIPKFQCKTCKNKFHSGCIYKWLKTSHKSNCPLCQTELN